jgi:tetratricopeptide (TPR) repeat protein/transcriptional regulator with XRE-family HTH domain
MDPAEVATADQLAGCLTTLRLRRDLSLADLAKAARDLPARPGFARALAKSTVSDMCAGKSVPSDETLRTFLAVCAVPPADVPLWLAAAARARTADDDRPQGARRVRDASPRGLGVHAAIEVPGAAGELPGYVPRDLDEQLRATIRGGTGFTLLVGSSSVGKTRSAYEALLAELPDRWLFHPDDPAQLAAFAAAPSAHTVVWLDEIQRYLSHGLTAGTIRALMNAKHPPVIIGTLWPDAFQAFRAPPAGTDDDPFAPQREVLNLATVLVVQPALTAAERDRAVSAAATDPRLAATLASSYGMTQALAAAPELIHRWEAAPDRASWALIAAAADARRLGVESPLPAALLRAAVPGYLSATERAKAAAGWFDTALRYATTELHGAAAVLQPVAVDMGAPTGYVIADYVLQHAARLRRTEIPPEPVWSAYAEHLGDADRLAAGNAAADRKLFRQANRLYRAAGPLGLPELAHMQLRTGHDEAAEDTWAEAITTLDDNSSRVWLAGRLAAKGRHDEAERLLRDAIAAGASDGHSRLGAQLAEWGRLDEAEEVLRAGVAGDDPDAWFGLAQVLEQQGRPDEAERSLREAIATDRYDETPGLGGGPRYWLLVLLRKQGRDDDAERLILDSMAADVTEARHWYAELLDANGRTDEVEQVWRDAIAADAGDQAAWYQLSWHLLAQDRAGDALDLWRVAIAAGAPPGHTGMAAVLEQLGRTEEAEQARRAAIAAGEPDARTHLAELLASQERTAEAEQLVWDAVAAGENTALGAPVQLLKKLGRTEEAEQIERYGLNPDGSIATGRL